MKILVDSDSCPVKDNIIEISQKYNIEVLFISSISHFSTKLDIDKSNIIYVDNSYQSADMELFGRAYKHDIIITDDYGLASLVLGKECYCISSRGYIYNKDNINTLLAQRYISMKERKRNKRSTKIKKRSELDDKNFEKSLNNLIKSIIKG